MNALLSDRSGSQGHIVSRMTRGHASERGLPERERFAQKTYIFVMPP
jgi:hypothetical protein